MRDSTSSARWLQGFVDHFLNRSDRLILRQSHARSGNHIGFGQHGIFDAAAEGILHEQLLQLKVVLGDDEFCWSVETVLCALTT